MWWECFEVLFLFLSLSLFFFLKNVTSLQPVLQGKNVSEKQCPFKGLVYGGERRRLNIAVHPHFCCL
jgi:hypothetical protein